MCMLSSGHRKLSFCSLAEDSVPKVLTEIRGQLWNKILGASRTLSCGLSQMLAVQHLVASVLLKETFWIIGIIY